MQEIIDYLAKQGVVVAPAAVKPSFVDPLNELDAREIEGLSYAKQSEGILDISGTQAESMSLASMIAVRSLTVEAGMSVLDTCAAPGLKGMYLNTCYKDLEYTANDISLARLQRLRRLFAKHSIAANVAKADARFLHKVFGPSIFDRVIVDAPCSGEGVALGGDDKQAKSWSSAKVNRLQQLQIKIVKSAYKVLKPGGRLVYATCTLNLNENERVIKKALGIQLNVQQKPLDINHLPALSHGDAWRIVPSSNSIGFFIAVIDKSLTEM